MNAAIPRIAAISARTTGSQGLTPAVPDFCRTAGLTLSDPERLCPVADGVVETGYCEHRTFSLDQKERRMLDVL